MGTDAYFRVQVGQRTAGTVARDALKLVNLERESLAAWNEAGDRERQEILDVVRAALIRLLESPHWVPRSIRPGAGRLEVSIVIETDDPGADDVARIRRAEAMRELRETLLEIARDMADRITDQEDRE